MPDMSMVRRDLFTSNLPSSEKGALARVLSRIGGSSTLSSIRSHAAATSTVVREGAEALVVGGLIGAAEGYFGAEIPVPFTGTPSATAGAPNDNPITVPVEAIAAAVGYGTALMFPAEEYAPTARRAGNIALALFAARKAHNYVYTTFDNKNRAAGATATWNGDPNGQFGVDKIADIARSFK